MELTELDRLIDLRAKQARQAGERARPEEAPWKESVRRYNSALEAASREAWRDYHEAQAERLRRTMESLAALHEERARELSNEPKGAE